jgi:hypothetical protein
MISVMRKAAALLLAAAVLTIPAFAQERQRPSPPAKAKTTIAGKNIAIDYSAPSKRERKIIGGLVPFDKVWRTGANEATTLVTDADLLIGGSLLVPKGTYTVFTVPGEKEWELIINKQTGQWGTRYDEAQDLGRVKMKVKPVKDTVETFAIDLKPGKGQDGLLTLTWENTQASVPFKVQGK